MKKTNLFPEILLFEKMIFLQQRCLTKILNSEIILVFFFVLSYLMKQNNMCSNNLIKHVSIIVDKYLQKVPNIKLS